MIATIISSHFGPYASATALIIPAKKKSPMDNQIVLRDTKTVFSIIKSDFHRILMQSFEYDLKQPTRLKQPSV